jgi:hypothetical protein
MVNSGKFQMFDYGKNGNVRHYNQTTPPLYDPSKVNIPTAMIWGGNDDLADDADVRLLLPLLPNVVYPLHELELIHLFLMSSGTSSTCQTIATLIL